jgi:phage terminase large subunit GpA-like protein
MDKGGRVAWTERKAAGDLSAIQHAWNLRIDRGEAAFNAEFQNAPLADDITTDKLDKRQLALRATKIARGIVPAGHTKLTAFVDVQDRLLYWLVASWSESFGGHVVAYGSHPDQGASFFEAGSARKTLALATPGAGFEAALRAGLDETARLLLARDWQREDGVPMRISQLMVDANWGQSTAVVRNFARSSPFAASILPSRGKGVGASGTPMGPRKNRGDRAGLNWLVGKTAEGTQIEATYDTNFWKTFVSARLRLGLGDPEAIMLHAGHHEMLIEHLVAEFPVRVEARGRSVDEWKSVARENHWWDCLVGCAVAASITGLEPAASEGGFRKRKKVAIPAGPDGKRVIVTKRAK